MNRRVYLEKLIFSQLFCFLLFMILVVITLLGLSLISKTIEPVVQVVNSLLLHEKIKINSIPFGLIFIKFILLSTLFMAIGFILNSVISAIYSCSYSGSLKKMYVNCEFDFEKMLIKAIKFDFFRMSYIFKPVALVITVGTTLFLITFLFFNSLLMLAGISLGILTFIISFTFYLLFFSLIVALLISFKRFLSAQFGINTLIRNINSTNSEIMKKTNKVFSSRTINYMVAPLYSTFALVLFVQILFILINSSFLSDENILSTISILFIDIVIWSGLNYLKSYLFYQSYKFL